MLRSHTNTLLLISLAEFIPEAFMAFFFKNIDILFPFILQAGGAKGRYGNGRKVASHFESKLIK